MDWVSIWKDIVVGLLLAGAVAVWVSPTVWSMLFLTSHPMWARFWGPLIGPVIAIFSFVCSIGNVPLAAVLWNNGISFGGVVAFIFADLIILPILNIYRKYYGWKMAGFIFGSFYAAMVGGALAIEFLFQILGWVPLARSAQVVEAGIHFNYTTVLNIIFLGLAGSLFIRFLRTGGPQMLRMMERPKARTHTYVCPMHPQIQQCHPGRCTICSMELVSR
jgi:uncharacterized membrane protein YraQ (UPF0718 family)